MTTEVRVEGLEALPEPVQQQQQQQQQESETDVEESSFVSCSKNRAVQVAIRVRPLQEQEAEVCLETLFDKKNLTLHAQDRRRRKHPTILRIGQGQTFAYDEVFPQETVQEDIYQHRVAPIVERCLEGYNATILAYGQTGSGKTYTMTGPPVDSKEKSEDQVGVIPRALMALFEGLEARRKEQENRAGYRCLVKHAYKVKVQFLELYMEDVRDLLQDPGKGSAKVSVRSIGNQEPEVLGSVKATVENAEDALALLKQGLQRRVTGVTSMNATSSRSHAIFSVMIEQTTYMTGAVSKGSQVKKSQFHFVDLAGSERYGSAKVDGVSDEKQRLRQGECSQINMGLLALGNVISALGDPKRSPSNGFIPYRDSKLTLLLKGSLGGNHHTLMVACVSPSSTNKDESVNTLRYANRAKNITNHVVVNLDRRSQLLNQLQSQVQSLAHELLVAYEEDNTGGVAFRTLLEKIAAGEKDRKLQAEASTPRQTTLPPSLSATATGEPRPSRHVSMIPKFLCPGALKSLQRRPEEVPVRLVDCDAEITNLREELKEAKEELVLALASERNPPDDGSFMSDLSESSFPSRIETIESFDSQDSVEIRGLRRRLCRRLKSRQGEDDAEEYSNFMKQHYEKVKDMSVALQEKEDARAHLVQRMAETNRAIASKHPTALPVAYASAVVYCSVLYCVTSVIWKAC